jgi:glycosyltransferase involved in cell wall biosynthesis
LKISIVIPTRNRPKSLENLLLSILQQTKKPDEVIVVDDSDINETEKLIRDNHSVFLSNGIALKYLRGNRENRSISAARNLGAAESIGEIVFFIDDDVILYKDYIEEILKTYKEYPGAKGVQGYIINEALALLNFKNFLLNAVKKVFMLGHIEKNKCTLQWGLTYPYFPDGIIECEWLHGTNMSLKKEVFTSFRFDENLRRRSIGEDVDLTSRIHKHYPHSLLLNPRAKLLHIQTPKKEKVDEYVMYSKIPYIVYLMAKNQKVTLKKIMRECWFLLGLFIVDGIVPLFFSKDAEAFFCLAKSFFSTFSHLVYVRKGDFRFIDSMIQAKRKID